MSLAVVSPFLEALDDCEHFLVVDFVVEFGGVEFAGVKGDGMVEVVGWGALGEDAGDGEVGGVGFEEEWERGIEDGEDGGGGEGGFERVEGGESGGSEVEHRFLTKKSGDGGDDVRETVDEPAVEVGESEEDLDVFDRGRR